MHSPVFVTGGSGFVGSAVVEELVARDYPVHALVNLRPLRAHGERVISFKGSLFDQTTLSAAMSGCQAVIHLVGIIMEKPSAGATFERLHYEAARNVVDAARSTGIHRFLHMSALGTRPGAVSTYHRTKYRAEQHLRASGLNWTIFRPSLIHGPGGEFMKMETAWARKKAPPFLFMPYFGRGVLGRGGAGLLQPVHVKDVARAFVDSLENPKTIGEIYPIAGPDRFTWPQLHHVVAQMIVGHQRWVMPLPVWYAKLLTHIAPARLLPFNRDQVIMSQEDNTTDLTKFLDHFGWSPRPFEASLLEYASQL